MTEIEPTSSRLPAPAIGDRHIALVDLLDRVLAGGVVIVGDVTLSISDVDLVRISLRTLITSVSGLDSLTDERDRP